MKHDGETMYQNFVRVIDMVNVIISTYQCEDMGDLLVQADKGSVGFGSGKDCWGFTLPKFARIYASKFKIESSKLSNKLWGDNYFDSEAKCWRKDPTTQVDSKPLKRAFVTFIMDPICKLTTAIMEGNMETSTKMLEILQITLSSEEKQLIGKHLLKAVLSKWLNAADTLLEMMVVHLPSPREA